MNLRTLGLAFPLLISLAACSKEGSGSGSASASTSAAPKGDVSFKKEAVEARMTKIGWKVGEVEEMDIDGEKRVNFEVSKPKGEETLNAEIDVLLLGEAFDAKNPKPAVEVGKTAVLRVAFTGDSEGAKSPDLEAIKKDIVAKVKPEKVTDDFFFKDYSEAAEKWKLSDQSSRGGGNSWGDVFQNYRFLRNDAGTVSIHAADASPGIEKGTTRIVGTTIVWVSADDPALTKQLLEAATGG